MNVPFLKVWCMDLKKFIFDRTLTIIVGKMTPDEQDDFSKVGSLVQKQLLGGILFNNRLLIVIKYNI
jgi:hypothetical protein